MDTRSRLQCDITTDCASSGARRYPSALRSVPLVVLVWHLSIHGVYTLLVAVAVAVVLIMALSISSDRPRGQSHGGVAVQDCRHTTMHDACVQPTQQAALLATSWDGVCVRWAGDD